MSVVETATEYVIYDPEDDTLMGRSDLGWVQAQTELHRAKRWLTKDNAQRHCYLDRFEVRNVTVTRTVEVTFDN